MESGIMLILKFNKMSHMLIKSLRYLKSTARMSFLMAFVLQYSCSLQLEILIMMQRPWRKKHEKGEK